MNTSILSILALIAFAGNSVLCRLALIDGSIDPLGFTVIRLASGALMLFALMVFPTLANKKPPTKKSPTEKENGSWFGAAALFFYAILFSYAYVSIDTATGALILFGSVQITMIAYSLSVGKRLSLIEWVGVSLAMTGFVYLVYPELRSPSISGLVMMMLSGVAWAAYTVLGKGAQNALRVTAFNFLRSIPMAALLLVFLFSELAISSRGVYFAVASGAITSGLGYAIWYAALKGLSNTQAGVAMVAVPVIAAIGGALFAGELITMRLMIASTVVLGGILMVIFAEKFQR